MNKMQGSGKIYIMGEMGGMLVPQGGTIWSFSGGALKNGQMQRVVS